MTRKSNHYLKRRSERWHYYRRVPKKYAEIDPRGTIRIALNTDSVLIAREKRDRLAEADEVLWSSCYSGLYGHDVDLISTRKRHKLAQNRALSLGFSFKPLIELVASDNVIDPVERVEAVAQAEDQVAEAKVLLGTIEVPKVTNRPAAQPLEGVVKQFGRYDDTREGGYVIIQSLNGEHIHTKVSETETFETLAKGQVITLQPHPQGARKIDHSIAEFAESHGGIYSKVHHVTEGGNVSPAYAQAHVRRLEALRRENLVVRQKDGTWRIPHDYLARASDYESEKAMRMPTSIDRLSTQTITQMEQARGATWLDKKMSEITADTFAGTKMQTSILKRQAALRQMGFDVSKDSLLSKADLEKLKDMDLRDAAKKLSEVNGKPYSALGSARSVEGIYQKSIDRPSGKFAVIERAKDFTLVPWRPVMDRNLGRSISGRVSVGGISWNLNIRKGITR